jgi:hypothetical protein
MRTEGHPVHEYPGPGPVNQVREFVHRIDAPDDVRTMRERDYSGARIQQRLKVPGNELRRFRVHFPFTHDESIVCQPTPASAETFTAFWAGQYHDPRERLYAGNIGEPLSAQRILELFTWKNGGELAEHKRQSIEQHYIGRLHVLERLAPDTTAEAFLERFAGGGAIWRIFWLHCWRPDRFPLYDHHVHRAMTFIEDGRAEELADVDDGPKVRLYLERYLPFYGRSFEGLDPRQVDRAMLTFGRFLRVYPGVLEPAGALSA